MGGYRWWQNKICGVPYWSFVSQEKLVSSVFSIKSSSIFQSFVLSLFVFFSLPSSFSPFCHSFPRRRVLAARTLHKSPERLENDSIAYLHTYILLSLAHRCQQRLFSTDRGVYGNRLSRSFVFKREKNPRGLNILHRQAAVRSVARGVGVGRGGIHPVLCSWLIWPLTWAFVCTCVSMCW